MTLDERTVELAVTAAQMARESGDPTNFICQAGWLSLSLLHELMAKEKQILHLREIGQDKKLMYWTMACVGRPDASKVKRIWISQALYLYEIINEGFGRVTE